MKWSAIPFFLARLAYAGFLFVTALYCLLTFIPFTYQQFILPGTLPWITTFVRIHPYLYAAALLVLFPTLNADLRAPRARWLTVLFLVCAVTAGGMLFWKPLLARLDGDSRGLAWAMVALLPLVGVAACDWLAAGGAVRWSQRDLDEDARLFSAAWRAALFLPLLYAAVLYLHGWLTRTVAFPLRQWGWSLLWSLVSHLLFFMGVFVVLSLVTAVAAMMRARRRTEFLAASAFAVAVIWMVFRSVVFAPLSFRGWQAELTALGLGVALVAFATGISVRLFAAAPAAAESGLELLLWPLHFLRSWGTVQRLLFFAALAALAYWLATATVVLDWEYLLQHLVAVLIWSLTFAAFYAIAPLREVRKGGALRYAVAVIALVGYVVLLKAEPRRQEQIGIQESEASGLVDEYANYDVSFRLADELVSGPRMAALPDEAGAAFYAFLEANTHIPRSHAVAPVDIKLVDSFQSAAQKPHVFVFVIDSLRRDYLGAYNPAVTFTPAFDSFARDSVVMDNAFTHYGGTALSEPAIWVGGMMLHKQYIQPFAPMNTLKKLLDAERYEQYASKDTILTAILGPAPELHELDANLTTMYYDLCTTLKEVGTRLPGANSPPMFVYTQPQNIHVSVIDREGRSVPAGESFPAGFNPPYASRVQRMDRCFGEFIVALQKAGIYDNSIIIVTADHGDSLGERGRWGHAYTLFPEIVRVPLIVHLPPAMKAALHYDPKAIAFLTDITPTLYYLLGQKPANDPLLGRPLFTKELDEQRAYRRNSYLVVSSYAPVYGILDRDGTKLYIADGVNYRDYYYDLAEDPRGVSKPIPEELRKREQGLIRQHVLAIARYYHFQ